jgi:hypothetical protein
MKWQVMMKIGGGGGQGTKLVLNWFPGEFHPQYSKLGMKHGLKGQTRAQRQGDFMDNSLTLLICPNQCFVII